MLDSLFVIYYFSLIFVINSSQYCNCLLHPFRARNVYFVVSNLLFKVTGTLDSYCFRSSLQMIRGEGSSDLADHFLERSGCDILFFFPRATMRSLFMTLGPRLETTKVLLS